MRRDTILAQAGSRWDERTGAVSMPIYQVATFRHPALGESTGFDYSRSGNPTRQALEETLAALEGGARGLAFSSGMAAIDCCLRLFAPGDRLLVTEDLYGGTYRLLEKVYRPLGIEAVYVDTSRLAVVERAWSERVRAVLVESPTNPLLKTADLPRLCGLAGERGALSVVDNTFFTPLLQRPLDAGADLVVYSGTKYLSGHNDVVSGLLVARDKELGERLYFHQNAAGAILGPQDAWLVLRGLKTLAVRMERQQQSARRIARFLSVHPRVAAVHYPASARDTDPTGAMVSFEVDAPVLVPEVLRRVRIFLFAESLGGTESLITFPAVQTHADIEPETRLRLGINDRLLRLSVGLEDAEDLIEDLSQALAG